MADWRHHINLRTVIDDCCEEYNLECVEEDCPEAVKEAIATEIEKAWPIQHFGPRIRDCVSIAEVNRVLNAVFNEADAKLVWCGL